MLAVMTNACQYTGSFDSPSVNAVFFLLVYCGDFILGVIRGQFLLFRNIIISVYLEIISVRVSWNWET